MKKSIISIGIILIIMLCGIIACCYRSGSQEVEVCAYIKSINENIVSVEVVEYVTSDDVSRIKELGIRETQMPNGYYINTKESEKKEYTLTDKTMYNFIDWTNLFVKEGSDRNYSTSKQEEFEEYINSYENSSPGMPFFIKVKGGNIISITEKMMP